MEVIVRLRFIMLIIPAIVLLGAGSVLAQAGRETVVLPVEGMV